MACSFYILHSPAVHHTTVVLCQSINKAVLVWVLGTFGSSFLLPPFLCFYVTHFPHTALFSAAKMICGTVFQCKGHSFQKEVL